MLGEKRLKMLMVSMLTVLFIFAAYTMTVAFTSDGGTPFVYMGTIIGYNSLDKIVTVQAGPNAERSFNLTDRVEVMRCDSVASIGDLKIGEMIKLGYSDESGGNHVVSWIDMEGGTC